MQITNHYIVMSFDTMREISVAEERCKAAGFEVRMIPLPTVISANCGMVLRFDPSILEKLRTYIAQEHIPYKHIFEVSGEKVCQCS